MAGIFLQEDFFLNIQQLEGAISLPKECLHVKVGSPHSGKVTELETSVSEWAKEEWQNFGSTLHHLFADLSIVSFWVSVRDLHVFLLRYINSL